VVRSEGDVEFPGLHSHSALLRAEAKAKRTSGRRSDRKVEKAYKEQGSVRGDIHRDQDATIVISVELTLPPDHSSKAPR
jgi:hypothetical protein